MKKFIFLCFLFTACLLMSSTVLLMEEYQFFGFLTLICATVGGVIAVRELTEKIQ